MNKIALVLPAKTRNRQRRWRPVYLSALGYKSLSLPRAGKLEALFVKDLARIQQCR